jgi:hypothetical protein
MVMLIDQSCSGLVAQALLVGLICVQRECSSTVTDAASSCGPALNPMIKR